MKRFTLMSVALVLVAGLFLFAGASEASAKGGKGSHMNGSKGSMNKMSHNKDKKHDWNRHRRDWDFRYGYGYSYPSFEYSFLPVCETTEPVVAVSEVPTGEIIAPVVEEGREFRHGREPRKYRPLAERGHGREMHSSHGGHNGGHGRG